MSDKLQESNEILGRGVKEKLANLKEYMPNQEQIFYDFAEFLSKRANDTLVPAGFNLMAELAVYDLQKGIDGFTGKPIQGSIAGYPPMMYQLLNMYIPQIAEAIFGKEYGTQVDVIRTQVQELLSKKG